jgi:hypothetical protein
MMVASRAGVARLGLEPERMQRISALYLHKLSLGSVDQPQRRHRTLRDRLDHAVTVGFRAFAVVNQDVPVVAHLENVVGDRLADPVPCALVEIDLYAHGFSYRTNAIRNVDVTDLA